MSVQKYRYQYSYWYFRTPLTVAPQKTQAIQIWRYISDESRENNVHEEKQQALLPKDWTTCRARAKNGYEIARCKLSVKYSAITAVNKWLLATTTVHLIRYFADWRFVKRLMMWQTKAWLPTLSLEKAEYHRTKLIIACALWFPPLQEYCEFYGPRCQYNGRYRKLQSNDLDRESLQGFL